MSCQLCHGHAASYIMDLIFRRSDGSRVSVDTVHPSLLRSSSFFFSQVVPSPQSIWSRYVAKPSQSGFPSTLCHVIYLQSPPDVIYLQSPPDVIVSWYLKGVSACPCAHLHVCHFQFLHLGASDWHCLHPVQHSWLNNHLVEFYSKAKMKANIQRCISIACYTTAQLYDIIIIFDMVVTQK